MKLSKHFVYALAALSLMGCATAVGSKNDSLPEGFVYLHDIDPSIIQEMRYFGDHNFMGKPIAGYLAPKCILTKEAAQALGQVQSDLKEYSMTLKVYDCYRPQKAVDSFVAWA